MKLETLEATTNLEREMVEEEIISNEQWNQQVILPNRYGSTGTGPRPGSSSGRGGLGRGRVLTSSLRGRTPASSSSHQRAGPRTASRNNAALPYGNSSARAVELDQQQVLMKERHEEEKNSLEQERNNTLERQRAERLTLLRERTLFEAARKEAIVADLRREKERKAIQLTKAKAVEENRRQTAAHEAAVAALAAEHRRELLKATTTAAAALAQAVTARSDASSLSQAISLTNSVNNFRTPEPWNEEAAEQSPAGAYSHMDKDPGTDHEGEEEAAPEIPLENRPNLRQAPPDMAQQDLLSMAISASRIDSPGLGDKPRDNPSNPVAGPSRMTAGNSRSGSKVNTLRNVSGISEEDVKTSHRISFLAGNQDGAMSNRDRIIFLSRRRRWYRLVRAILTQLSRRTDGLPSNQDTVQTIRDWLTDQMGQLAEAIVELENLEETTDMSVFTPVELDQAEMRSDFAHYQMRREDRVLLVHWRQKLQTLFNKIETPNVLRSITFY
jgi:hypothetical protein